MQIETVFFPPRAGRIREVTPALAGKQVFYKLYINFKGGVSMSVYTIEEIAEKVRPIAERYGLGKVYVFGSYARGEATEDSDIDLLVDAEKIKGMFALGGLYSDLEEAFDKKIDMVTFGQIEQSRGDPLCKRFIEEVELDRKAIYK